MSSLRRVLIVLPGTILLPGEELRLHRSGDADRQDSLTRACDGDGLILLGAPATDGRDGASIEGLLPMGTLASVEPRRSPAAGRPQFLVRSLRRVRLHSIQGEDGHLSAAYEDVARAPEQSAEVTLGRLTDVSAGQLALTYGERVQLLTTGDPAERLAFLDGLLLHRFEGEDSEDEDRERASRSSLAPRSREERHQRHLRRFERALRLLDLPPATESMLLRDLEHLGHSAPDSTDAARRRSHLEWALELPWSPPRVNRNAPRFGDVAQALSKSHVGLDEVKERIGELLAIRELGGGARGTVLCFQGPPGTGKSSMARAVATALGREFVTIPVGAMIHERELVGSSRQERASPGAILSGLHRCRTNDPVILLDEIDKISLGGEGTASGALLLLLDPEHNTEFLDHYLGLPFDLSRCLFLATANEVDELPETLLDRMELLPFEGYTEREKYQIARKHLLPRAREHAGISTKAIDISPAALRSIIRNYTEEAGVRHLQRVLVALARKAAVNVVEGGEGITVLKSDLALFLGPRTVEEELRLARPTVGCATGLAWTSIGGALLPVEALAMPGAGRMILTGQIGEVMRESVQTAISYLRTCFRGFGLNQGLLDELDLHLHFPSAATPKDGPSGGVAIATALVSLFLSRPARHDIAMTGEMSLHGALLPVGGLREKLLAAIRCGIPEVIVPARNAEDVLRLPSEIRERVIIHLVEDIHQVLDLAILPGARRGRRQTTRSSTSSAEAPRSAKKRGAKRARGKDDVA